MDVQGLQGAVISVAPDSKHFFFVTRRGDLDCDCTIFELQVFTVAEVARSLARRSAKSVVPLRTMMLKGRDGILEAAAWVGPEEIDVRGNQEVDVPEQAYRLNVISGELRALTQVPVSQTLARYGSQGHSVIFSAYEKVRTPRPAYPFFSATQASLADFTFHGGVETRRVFHTYASQRGGAPWRLTPGFVEAAPWFSPDSRWAIVLKYPETAPEPWRTYDAAKSGVLGAARDPFASHRFNQFTLVDFERQHDQAIVDAPTGVSTSAGAAVTPQVLWSADSRHAVLVNTALPLTAEGTSAERMKMAYIVSYDTQSGQWAVLEPLRQPSGRSVKEVGWVKPGREFLVRHEENGRAVSGTLYSLQNSGWIAREVGTAVTLPATTPPASKPAQQSTLVQGVSVGLSQGLNDPPMIVASKNGRRISLLKPDPALQGVALARTVRFQWRDGTGVSREGNLTLPRQMPAQGKIPLVIQTTAELLLDAFNPDGPFRGELATQALAAKGIAVLNIEGSIKDRQNGAEDGGLSLVMERLESGAKALAQRYPIDLERIGLVGFSRTGYEVRYTITHPRELHFAAAVIADSAPGTYFSLLTAYALGLEGFFTAHDRSYGGPFVSAKSTWLEREVLFNVDRVQTPILFTDHGSSTSMILETYGAFKSARKPFDFLVFPDAGHEITNPRQWEAAMEATTDWMAFWLLGIEDARLEKAERYETWRAQRNLSQTKATQMSGSSSR